MFIFIDPSENRTNSKSSLDGIECPGLEAMTGADFVISRLPIAPTAAIEIHIQNRSLFCQRKFGYDAIGDFNQIWLEIARMQSCGIPMQQAVILPIGIYKSNEDGYLRITGQKPLEHNKSILYETYLKNEAAWAYSGVQVRRLNDEAELPIWCKAQYDELIRIEDRGSKKEVYPQRPVPQFEPDSIWQETIEISPRDPRYFLIAGWKNAGIKLVNSVQEYIHDNLLHLDGNGYNFLKVLSDEDSTGKPKHNVKGWGKVNFTEFRQMLGLARGFNLSIEEVAAQKDFTLGWFAFGEVFEKMLNEGHNPKVAFDACMKQVSDFWSSYYIKRDNNE